MNKGIFVALIICFLIVTGGCSNGEKKDTTLTVSAASSLKDVLEEIGRLFQKDYPHIEVRFNFGASGALKQQIEQGAPVDLFFSASVDHFEELEKSDFIHSGSNVVSNELVLITSKQADIELDDFIDLSNKEIERIAIGTPSVVPAGTYAQQALQYDHAWEDIQTKIVYAKDVRQVLTYVETENVQAGIVYKTDALSSERVKVIAIADAISHEPITYPIGILRSSKSIEEAKIFSEYLKRDEIKELWQQFGFIQD